MNEAHATDSRTRGLFVQQWLLTLKELRETLRDRRTTVTLFAMPLLLYPLLGIGMRFLTLQQPGGLPAELRIVVASREEGEWLKQSLDAASELLKQDDAALQGARPGPDTDSEGSLANASDSTAGALTDVSSERPGPAPVVTFFEASPELGSDLSQVVEEGRADLGVRVETIRAPGPGRLPSTRVELIQQDGSVPGRNAADYVQRRLNRLNVQLLSQIHRQRDPGFQMPLQQVKQWLTSTSRVSAIAGLLPLILLLMTVTGGVYPAIDLTAGERERDTLETLIALPLPKSRLLLAKYAAVVTVTMLTGLFNLLAMTVTLYALNLDSLLFGGDGLTAGLVVQLIATLVVFAAFFSAMLLLLTSSARSFKEAQALLIPLLMLSLAPGLVILLPGWHLTLTTAVAPVINMLLLARDVLDGSVELLPAALALICTLVYAAAALSLAARIFGSEAASVGSRGRWTELLSRPTELRSTPSVAEAVGGLAILFPLFFLASGLAARDPAQAMSTRLIGSGLLTAILFAGWPLLLLRWFRVHSGDALAMRRPPALAWPAALLLGLSAWPSVFELVITLQSLGIGQLDEARAKLAQSLLTGWQQLPLPLIVVTLGVLPGCCEELFFRGYLFGGLRDRCGGLATVLITGVAFGLFHVILAGGAAPERVAPSLLLGLLLGWVRLRTGSLWPSVVLHVTHNSLLLTLAHTQEQLKGWGVGLQSSEHLPAAWLAASAVAIAAGIGLMMLATSSEHEPSGA
jgi:ABC-2 type transport system permease protein/sodium transport system permease protein